jgi:hypothetical protein
MEFAGLGQLAVTKPLTEQEVVDNSTIAGWIMAFSEIGIFLGTDVGS